MAGTHASQTGSRKGSRPTPWSAQGAGTDGSALPRNIASLTSLRGFAALAVFVFHLDMFGILHLPGASLAYAGVGFFFILSGFVLTWSVRPGTSLRLFYRRRFARVYPSHFVVLLIAFAAGAAIGRETGALAVITNLLLIQGWWPNQEIAYGLNGAAWSLSCEAAFYACFPLLVRALRAARPRTLVLVPTAWLAVTVVIALADPAANRLMYHYPPARMGEFLLGIAAAVAVQAGWRPRLRLAPAVAITGFVTLVVAILAPETTIVGASLALPFTAIIVAGAMGDVAGRTRLLKTRALIYAGEVSFCFYLVHQLVLGEIAPRLTGPIGAIAGVSLSVLFAVMLHHGVEKPLQVRLSRRPPPTEASAPPGPTAGLVAPASTERRRDPVHAAPDVESLLSVPAGPFEEPKP